MLARTLYHVRAHGKVFWLTFQGWVAANVSVENTTEGSTDQFPDHVY
jgi:hypothetical protein